MPRQIRRGRFLDPFRRNEYPRSLPRARLTSENPAAACNSTRGMGGADECLQRAASGLTPSGTRPFRTTATFCCASSTKIRNSPAGKVTPPRFTDVAAGSDAGFAAVNPTLAASSGAQSLWAVLEALWIDTAISVAEFFARASSSTSWILARPVFAYVPDPVCKKFAAAFGKGGQPCGGRFPCFQPQVHQGLNRPRSVADRMQSCHATTPFEGMEAPPQWP